MHVMTAQFCMMHTTTEPEITAPSPPSTEAKPGPLLAHNDTSASSGGHADEEDYAYKEWGAKRRKKKEHSLTVAVTRSQKRGAQTKADPTRRQVTRAEERQETLRRHPSAQRTQRRKQRALKLPVSERNRSYPWPKDRNCDGCNRNYTPEPCTKHASRLTRFCQQCRPTRAPAAAKPAGADEDNVRRDHRGYSEPSDSASSGSDESDGPATEDSTDTPADEQTDDNSQLIFRVNVNNERGRALLDSGASIDFVDRRFVSRLKPQPARLKQSAQITLGDNSVIKSTEACDLSLVLNNRSMRGQFQIIDLPDSFQLIMGMRYLRRHDCRPILSQRTASFRPDGTGTPFMAAGLSIMSGGLPHSKEMRGQDTDGAIFLLDTNNKGVYNDDVSQYEVMSQKEFKATLAAAQSDEQKRQRMTAGEQRKRRLTEPQSFYVENLEQYVANLPPKAERALHRERQAAQRELFYHRVEQPTDLTYWTDYDGTGQLNYIHKGSRDGSTGVGATATAMSTEAGSTRTGHPADPAADTVTTEGRRPPVPPKRKRDRRRLRTEEPAVVWSTSNLQDTGSPVPQEDTDGTVPRDDRREETCETGVLSTVDRGVAANSQQDDNARSKSRLWQIRGSRVNFNNGSEEITSELAQDVEISPAKADVEITDTNTRSTATGSTTGYESHGYASQSLNSLSTDSKRSRTRRDAYTAIPGISKIWVPGCTVYENPNSLMSESAQIRSRLNAYTAVPEHSSKPVKPSTLNALTDKGRERYLTRTVSESAAKERDEFKQTFAKIQEQTLPESEINTPHPEQAALAKSMLQNQRRWKCLREMEEATVMASDDPLVIEDKDGEHGPPPNRSYKVPKHLLPQLSEFIQELLKKKFIEPVPHGKGGRAWYSPILILKKPNGKGYRFVVDLRAVNARTKAVHYYMPDQHELYDRIKHSKYLSMLDARSGYFQAPLAEESRFKCSFKCELGSYRFRVLPMGLVASAAYFQRWIESKLDRHGVLYRKVSSTSNDKDVYIDSDGMKCRGFVCIYLDDLVVFSRDATQHRKHLERLFDVLSTENIFLNTEKCELFCKHIRYLGAIVGSGKLFMCPRKVYSVINMPLPNEGQDQIRMFLGLTGYYRRFISDYAEVALPLMELLMEWTSKARGRNATRTP